MRMSLEVAGEIVKTQDHVVELALSVRHVKLGQDGPIGHDLGFHT